MADVREMRIFSSDQIDVSEKLPEILKNFSKEVIRNNPENLVEFCREYFEEKRKEKGGANTFSAGSQNGAPDFEALGKMISAQAMMKYDSNNDGVLSKAEAEPMFREAFESLSKSGKLSSDYQWSTAIFADGWKQIDSNKSDTLDIKEIERFSVHIMKLLLS